MDSTDIRELIDRKAKLRRLPEPVIRRALRQRAGLSQAELASVLGVNRASISRYESGDRSPHPDVAERYTELLTYLAKAP